MATPDPSKVQDALDDAYSSFAADDDGSVSDLYPPLAIADPATFGIGYADVEGGIWTAGDADAQFVLMSVAKPFTFALVCDVIGVEAAGVAIGVNATGLAFNSLEAVERWRGPGNPMVNAGAIATVGLLGEGAWPAVIDGLSRFAGRELSVDHDVLEAVSASNHQNRALVNALDAIGALASGRSGETLETYTKQCCVLVTSRDLAVMGATLANGGVNPLTGNHVVSGSACRAALAVMTTAGLYETSGEWLYRVQLPGKSGVSGGIVGVSPRRGAFATYSPRIDAAANSVRGQETAAYLSERLSLGILTGC